MTKFKLPLYFANAVAAWLCLVSPAVSSTVTTLAGSGLPGIIDGSSARARFLMPTALAYLASGDVVVVDSAAQRVRVVSATGSVRTLAGSGALASGSSSVAAGYRDGDARTAQFNWPRGVAVGRDGTVYVADTGNHCIRTIKNGTVRTVLGSPARPGSPLTEPVGIAVDTAGNLYVADVVAGMKKISPDGKIESLLGFRGPFAVTVLDTHHGRYLYAADADGIVVRLPNNRTDWRLRYPAPLMTSGAFEADPARRILERRMTDDALIGSPAALTLAPSFPMGYLLYADVRTNSIRVLLPEDSIMMVVAGAPTEDASGVSAGFADGDAGAARFNAPMGTATRMPGTVAIADTGNRRIRMLHFPADTVLTGSVEPQDKDDGTYRIGYMGNSFVYYNSAWSDSTAGNLERRLRSDGALSAQRKRAVVRVITGASTPETWDSLFETIAATSLYDTVVLNVNAYNLGVNDWTKLDSAVVTRLTEHLAKAREVLAAAKIPLVVVIHPVSNEVGPGESLPLRLMLPYSPIYGMKTNRALHESLRAAASAAGVRLIDAYPDFQADEAVPGGPLFGFDDYHFARRGREVMANAIGRGLEEIKPWATDP